MILHDLIDHCLVEIPALNGRIFEPYTATKEERDSLHMVVTTNEVSGVDYKAYVVMAEFYIYDLPHNFIGIGEITEDLIEAMNKDINITGKYPGKIEFVFDSISSEFHDSELDKFTNGTIRFIAQTIRRN